MKKKYLYIGLYLSIFSAISIVVQLIMATMSMNQVHRWSGSKLAYTLFDSSTLDLWLPFFISVLCFICGTILFLYSVISDRSK